MKRTSLFPPTQNSFLFSFCLSMELSGDLELDNDGSCLVIYISLQKSING